MRSTLPNTVALSCGIALFALCASGWNAAWGGSVLEVGGLVDASVYISDDTGGLSGNTVTLGGAGSITSTGGTPAQYMVTSGYTLKTGANAITVQASSSAAAGISVHSGGALEIDSGGWVELSSLNSVLHNQAGTITNNDMIMVSGGIIRNDDGATMYNNNLIVLNGTGRLYHADSTGGERLVNTDSIWFNGTTTRYHASGHAGTIDNASGIIRIAFDHGDRDSLLGDLNTANAGTINFTTGDVGADGFTNGDFDSGLFLFSAAQNTTAAIDVGNASVRFENGGTFGADVTAATIDVQGAPSTFNTGVRANGNLRIFADTSYDAAFSGHSLYIESPTLTLGSSADVTIVDGQAMTITSGSGKVALASGAQLTLASGSEFYSAAGMIDNSANAAAAGVRVAGDVRDGASNNALNNVLDALVRGGGGDIGNVVITGDLQSSSVDAGSSMTAGRLTIEGTQGTAAAPCDTYIDSWGATLVLAGGGHFSHYVSSDTAIEIKGNSVFYSHLGIYLANTPTIP